MPRNLELNVLSDSGNFQLKRTLCYQGTYCSLCAFCNANSEHGPRSCSALQLRQEWKMFASCPGAFSCSIAL
jgi:hypothetical protein